MFHGNPSAQTNGVTRDKYTGHRQSLLAIRAMEVFAALVERARDRLGGREWKDRQDVESLLLFSTIY